jgi:PTH2 family peptidyl-tRNA hydrolase
MATNTKIQGKNFKSSDYLQLANLQIANPKIANPKSSDIERSKLESDDLERAYLETNYLEYSDFEPSYHDLQCQAQSKVQAQTKGQAQTKVKVQAQTKGQAQTKVKVQAQTKVQTQTKVQAQTKVKAQHQDQDQHCSNKEYTAYLIINDDLKMSKGKIASQSAHAILNVHRFMASNGMENKAWSNHGEKIVVLRASELIIRQLLTEYGELIINKKKDKLNVFPVYDAGRTEVESGSLTVLATTPITDSSKPDILRILKLL